mgnify:CR=1 FL=1
MWIQSLTGKIPWSRKWKPILVFLLGKFCGQRSLAGYSPWDREELDMTHTDTHTHTQLWSHGSVSLKIMTIRNSKLWSVGLG